MKEPMPPLDRVVRRISSDFNTQEVLEDIAIEPGVSEAFLRRKVPGGPRKLLTTLVFRQVYPSGESQGGSASAVCQGPATQCARCRA